MLTRLEKKKKKKKRGFLQVSEIRWIFNLYLVDSPLTRLGVRLLKLELGCKVQVSRILVFFVCLLCVFLVLNICFSGNVSVCFLHGFR